MFIITQTINGIRRILVAVLPKSELTGCEKPYNYIFGLGITAVSFNAAANFFIFVLYNQHFRKQLDKLWKKIRCKNNQIGDLSSGAKTSKRNINTSSSQT